MLNYLLDCQRSTPIGMLPDIINHNNDAIEAEFAWIFDTSLNRLTKSLYAPTGSVKAHFGEFVNLSAEYITVKNVDSLKTTILAAVDSIVGEEFPHNNLNGRFSDTALEELYGNSYAHDANYVICTDGQTVEEKFVNVQDQLDALDASRLAHLDASIAAIEEEIKALDVEHLAHLDASIKELEEKINLEVDASIKELDKKINDVIDSSIKELNTRIDADVKALNASIDKVQTAEAKLKNDINEGKEYVTVDDERYSLAEIAALVSWKNSLTTYGARVTIDGVEKDVRILCYECTDDQKSIAAANTALNETIGSPSSKDESEVIEYSDAYVEAALDVLDIIRPD